MKHTRALDVHKVRVGALYKPLELVGALLTGFEGVQEVDGDLGDAGIELTNKK